jgi:hypothetical protein
MVGPASPKSWLIMRIWSRVDLGLAIDLNDLQLLDLVRFDLEQPSLITQLDESTLTMTTSPASPCRAGAPPGWVGGGRCQPLPLGLLPAVEGVVHQRQARGAVLLGDPGLGPAQAVGFGGAGVVVELVSDGVT